MAGQAKLGHGDWHAEYLGEQRSVGDTLLRQLLIGESERSAGASDVFGVLTARRQSVLAQLAGDAVRLTRVEGMQAYCLECAGTVRRGDEAALSGWVARLIALVS